MARIAAAPSAIVSSVKRAIVFVIRPPGRRRNRNSNVRVPEATRFQSMVYRTRTDIQRMLMSTGFRDRCTCHALLSSWIEGASGLDHDLEQERLVALGECVVQARRELLPGLDPARATAERAGKGREVDREPR